MLVCRGTIDSREAEETVIRDDEPVLGPDPQADDGPAARAPDLVQRIRRLVTSQLYGVLSTHGDGHAYGSLVAFAFAEDLRSAVFATPMTTRKYRLLNRHDRVALVVDDRPEHPQAMMDVTAITVTGRAREIEDAAERRACGDQLVARHPQLRSFVAAESCAVFRIEVARYFHVTRFQEVQQWVPGRS
jgi:nitroimidazol reductase NimA-like FMN-containing flavoprotein (pyridoxamine 5'-phosphate oxidase superfamily)